MSDALALFARTFVIGLAVAAPVGAMGVLCVQRTLARGWRWGMITGLGIATADGIYAGLAAFGFAALTGALVAWQAPVRIVGGAVLVWLGWRAMTGPQVRAAEGGSETMRPLRLYTGAVALTLTNPMTIMAFAAVFATAGLAQGATVSSAALATLGVASGSLAWWMALVTGVALARHAVSERAARVVAVVSGLAVAGFGVAAIVAGVAPFV